MDALTVPLSEVFGPTWQGEGPHAGRRCWFVRLGLCNLSCEWCDTPFTWDQSRYDLDQTCPPVPVSDLASMVTEADPDMVVISGGEPLMHRPQIASLVSQVQTGVEWHVETNGTIAPPEWWLNEVAHTTVSPKINTRDPERKRIKPGALLRWRDVAAEGRACFKFVATSRGDLDTIEELVEQLDLDTSTVWVMPEGRTAGDVLEVHRHLADPILAAGYNTTTRLHTLLWNDERRR